MGAADRLGSGLGQAEILDLARALTSSAIAPTVSSIGTSGIDAVLVVEVDDVEPGAPQARVAGRADIVGSAVDALEAAVLAAHVAELGRDHDPLAPLAHDAADQLLVRADAVHVGGVEEGDAEIERAVDRGDRLRLVAAAVEIGHAHAAEAEGGDFEALLAELCGSAS